MSNPSELSRKSYSVEVGSSRQFEILQTVKELDGHSVKIIPSPTFNTTQGLVISTALTHTSIGDILEDLREQGVTKVERLSLRTKKGDIAPSNKFVLHFSTSVLPKLIIIGGTHKELVEPYFPLPWRCSKCQVLGHISGQCRSGTKVCIRCGSDEHSENCAAPPKCVNCLSPHSANSNECPHYKMRKEILHTRIIHNLTTIEAESIIYGKYFTEGKPLIFKSIKKTKSHVSSNVETIDYATSSQNSEAETNTSNQREVLEENNMSAEMVPDASADSTISQQNQMTEVNINPLRNDGRRDNTHELLNTSTSIAAPLRSTEAKGRTGSRGGDATEVERPKIGSTDEDERLAGEPPDLRVEDVVGNNGYNTNGKKDQVKDTPKNITNTSISKEKKSRSNNNPKPPTFVSPRSHLKRGRPHAGTYNPETKTSISVRSRHSSSQHRSCSGSRTRSEHEPDPSLKRSREFSGSDAELERKRRSADDELKNNNPIQVINSTHR